jgi:hypothetical protein
MKTESSIALPMETVTTETTIQSKPWSLLFVALLLGWSFDRLFWEQSVGVNFAIFMSLSVLGGVIWLFSNGARPAARSLWLLGPFLFFIAFTFFRREPLTVFLAFAFTLFVAGLLAGSFIGGRWLHYGLLDYFYKFFSLLGNMFVGGGYFAASVHMHQKTQVAVENRIPFWPLMRGLAIALPIVICFGSLLAAGDVVFNQKIQDLFDFEDIFEFIWRSVVVLFWAYALIGVFRYSALKSRDERLIGEDKPIVKSFLGFTESSVILACVNLLFLIFVIVQFQYFFGGERNIGVEGYTYSQYARRGFNELITVAFFSLVLILGLSAITRRESETQKKVYSGLGVALAVLVLIILVSAYQRIMLGISWHGYSRLRLYPSIFLIWLGLLFATVVVLEILRRPRFFAPAVVFASMGFAVSLMLFNVDDAIVRRNVYRGWHGKNLNVPHLASLSNDAVPALAYLYLYERMPTSTRDGVGAILACYRYFEDWPHISTLDWRSFNYSSWQAHRSLEIVRPYLAGYTIRYNNWPIRVRSPHGQIYECQLRTTLEED